MPFRFADDDPLRSSTGKRLLHLLTVLLVVALLIAISLQVPVASIDEAAVWLVLVLLVVGIASMWGAPEAFVAAIAGGFGFDFFLTRQQFATRDERWLVLATFLITAIASGQIAAWSRCRRIAAERQQREVERLYQLVNALLDSCDGKAALAELTAAVAGVLRAGTAIYRSATGEIVRIGKNAEAIPDSFLREAATKGRRIYDSPLEYTIAPIYCGGETIGSIGIVGVRLSAEQVEALAGRIGLVLARLYAMERATEAEVVRRAEELKSAVLDALAHEIRGPLNSIKIAATALLSSRPGSELNGQEMLTIIDEEVDRMDRFLDQAIQLARLEAGELFLNKESHDIAGIIRAAIEEMGALITSHKVHVRLEESLPSAECDQRLLLRVLKELLNNALKYSPVGSPLTIFVGQSEGAVVIDVVDQGPGVAADERERIFEKRYRGRVARIHTPGDGLGLASAKCIVEAHGGEIWVTSPPEGGAAFHVSLPFAGAIPTKGIA